MKKMYITPEMEVVKVDVVSVLAASILEGESTGDTDSALGREENVGNSSSRPGIWEQGW